MNSVDALVTEEERERFLTLLGIEAGLLPEQQAQAVARCSQTSVVHAFIRTAGIPLSMLRDILDFLGSRVSCLNTTGFTLILPVGRRLIREVFGPQVANVLASFAEEDLRDEHWQALADELEKKHVPRLMTDLRLGEVRYAKRLKRRELVRIAHGHPRGSIYEDRLVFDERAYVRALANKRVIDLLVATLDSLGGEMTERLRQVQSRYRAAFKRSDRVLRESRQASARLARKIRRDGLEHVLDNVNCLPVEGVDEQWLFFAEQVLRLGRLQKHPDVAELLQLQLLRNRPQLYEIWLLTRIAAFYESNGATVTLLGMDGEDVWRIKYAHASEPVLHIRHGTGAWHLYFQRRAPGASEMPDLMLTADDDLEARWVVDPKYSEKAGYRLSAYKETATAYGAAFDLPEVFVCEYFDRKDLDLPACHEFPGGGYLITGVRPGAAGLGLLRKKLRELHSWDAAYTILAVDCSASFRERYLVLYPRLQALAERAAVTICFAGVARVVESLPADPANFGDTTLLRPLCELIREVSDSDGSLLLISDDQFNDDSAPLRSALEASCSELDIRTDWDPLR